MDGDNCSISVNVFGMVSVVLLLEAHFFHSGCACVSYCFVYIKECLPDDRADSQAVSKLSRKRY